LPVHLYEHVDFDVLWSQFTQDISAPLDEPLAREVIVVPAAGWESYFTRRLAHKDACWAHYTFPTLGSWLASTLRDVLGPEQAPVRDVEAFTWAIAAKLPGLLNEPAFASLRAYLEEDTGDNDLKRRIDLSRCIAGLFDQYLMFRPELIAAWQAGNDWLDGQAIPPHAAWQRRLFEALSETIEVQSVQITLEQLHQQFVQGKTGMLPQRVSVWIAGGLPPSQMDFLDLVGRYCEMRLYVVAPSHLYCADMAGRRQILRRLRDSDMSLREFCKRELRELMHPLLESMGRLSQDRQLLLIDHESETWQTRDLPEPDAADAGSDGLLGTLQAELREACEPNPVERSVDPSLSIHSCHSAIREVEVLRDQIRDALEASPDLRAEDVVVLCPDLETYAPLIQAVFESTDEKYTGHLPFRLAGRSPRRTRPLIDAYFRVLEVLQGRLTASAIIDLLNLSAVASAVGLERNEVDAITDWIQDAGIRWGLDPEHRTEEGLPESDLNTWQFGLDRMLLGYAMPPGGGQLFADTLALDRAEGMASETLGKLWSLIANLKDWRLDFGEARPWTGWQAPLGKLLEQVIDTNADEAGAQKIRDAVDQLVSTATDQGFDQPLAFRLVCQELTRQIDTMAGGAAFRLECITFCETAAMRSLPFAVIGLLGMNDGVFPRMDRPVGFDLMQHATQRGDRSARLEDKHLFLEALLAARQRVIVTYQGQSLRDHRTRPASILVEELIDCLTNYDSTEDDDNTPLRERLVTEHALQSFSPHYFSPNGDKRLFSYEAVPLEAARSLTETQLPAPAFVSTPLDPLDELEEIPTRALTRLVERPWEILLGRLGASLRDLGDSPSDREPLIPNALERWKLGDIWVRERVGGEAPEILSSKLTRSGLMPSGALGSDTLEAITLKADPVVDAAQTAGVTASPGALMVRLEVADVLIKGHLSDVTDGGIRRATYATVDAKRMPSLWIEHLLLSASSPQTGFTSVLVGRGKEGYLELPPVDPKWAKQQLHTLVQLYRLAHQLPLPFFPASVKALIDAVTRARNPLDLNNDEDAQRAIDAARQAYARSWIGTPTAQVLSVRAAFNGRNPFEMTCEEAPALEAGGKMPLFLKLFELICRPMLDTLQGGGTGD
jgi:exodeoxyribonuclease V gamma subunit